MSEGNGIEKIECKTAREFLEKISINSNKFLARPGKWLFRGHSSSAYKLLSTVLRTEETTVEEPLSHVELMLGRDFDVVPNKQIQAYQVQLELHLIKNFMEIANDSGLDIPDVNAAAMENFYALAKYVKSLVSGKAKERGNSESLVDKWPFPDMYKLLALAQHNGFPTRLLDWTYSPRNAAYFAASSAAKDYREASGRNDMTGPQRVGTLSVWAISNEITGQYPVGDANERVNAEMISIPFADNINMFAQNGTFLVVPVVISEDSLLKPLDRMPMEDLFKNTIIKYFSGSSTDLPLVYQISLPVCEAAELLGLLARDGVRKSRLFPGYSNIVSAIEEEWYRGDLEPEPI